MLTGAGAWVELLGGKTTLCILAEASNHWFGDVEQTERCISRILLHSVPYAAAAQKISPEVDIDR